MEIYDKIVELTKKLVAIPSINPSIGERHVAEAIEQYLQEIPYFKEHPEYIISQEENGTGIGRKNVFALLKGTKDSSDKTIILHGHMDTVGVDDFGSLKDVAFDCEALMKRLPNVDLPEDARRDLESGDWLFGRGAADMKGGVAVLIILLDYLSQHPENLSGNLLLSANFGEEAMHSGIIEALDVLVDLKEKEQLNYVLAINNDFITPIAPGDATRYVYTGSVGKLLPCFYVIGRATHVGQPFEGFEATAVAAELDRLISWNMDFSDTYNGETSNPPLPLKMTDLKPRYNVQTPIDAFVYANLFVHNRQLKDVLKQLKETAAQALENVSVTMNTNYERYCSKAGLDHTPLKEKTQVLEYDEVWKLAEESFEGDLPGHIDDLSDKLLSEGKDEREVALGVTKELCEVAGIKIPTVVVFFAAPYCPHNTLKAEVFEEKQVYDDISAIVKEFGEEQNEKMGVLQFFPSLSDSSYLKIDDDDASTSALIRNFPEYHKLYDVPLDKIKSLNIPAINYGCWAKDCHKWTERVYLPYSFEALPKLILKTIQYYLT